MKGIHVFETQAKGLQYFTLLLIEAANGGWVRGAKPIFRRGVEEWKLGPQWTKNLWGVICLPILSFFRGVVEGGDDSMRCDFSWTIEVRGGVLQGSMEWFGQATLGRFVRLVLGADGSARVYYDTGYTEEGEPKGSSTFLSLPEKGDEDLSGMERSEFQRLADSAS